MARRPYGIRADRPLSPGISGSHFRNAPTGIGGAADGASVVLMDHLYGRKKRLINGFLHPTDVSLATPATLVETDIAASATESITLAPVATAPFGNGAPVAVFTGSTVNAQGAQWVQGGATTGYGIPGQTTVYSRPVVNLFTAEVGWPAASVAAGVTAVGLLVAGTASLDATGADVATEGAFFRFVGGSATHTVTWNSAAGFTTQNFTFTHTGGVAVRIAIRMVIKSITAGVVTSGFMEFYVNDALVSTINSGGGKTLPTSVSPGIAVVRLTGAYTARVSSWAWEVESRGSLTE